MRRTQASRIPPQRRQLAFEPLESRELLAADVGFEWWSVSDAPSDDWSWTFDDSSSFDTGGGAWWDDSWWVGDTSSDASFGGGDGTGFGAGGSDWSTDVGGVDAGGTADVTPVVDVVTPPAPADAGGATSGPVPTVVDFVITPSPQPVPQVVVVAPGVDSPAPPSTPVEAESKGDVSDGAEIVVQGDPAPDADTTAIDATVDGGPSDGGPLTVDVTNDMTDGSWAIETTPADGLPSQPQDDAGAADETVTNVTTDEAVVPPTIVIVTPAAGGTSRPVDVAPAAVQPVAVQPAATAPAADRFAGWGAMFFQAFGRPAGDADGSPAGGQTGGQPGSGRVRLRLPFRPIA